MRSSCVNHPPKEHLVLLRAWQVQACEGNHCAAALLSFFEYWHNHRLAAAEKAAAANAVAERHGERGTQDTSLWQFHTDTELQEGLLGLYSTTSIRAAIALLVLKGFLTLQKNPNPKYAFDRTRFFQFQAETVNAYLRDVTFTDSSVENTTPFVENNGRSAENNGAIPEMSSEISSEMSSEKDSNTSSLRSEVFRSAEDSAPPIPAIPPLVNGAMREKTHPPDGQDWPEDDRPIYTWLAGQELLTSRPVPLDFAWWQRLTDIIGWPGEAWLGKEFAKMEMWMQENPTRKPTPKGMSRFLRTWLEKAYTQERRHGTPTPKEVHIHYDRR